MQDMRYGKFIGAACIYAAFAVYLYQPYFKNFDGLQYLLVVNVCLAALGCFVLSRRWVSSFAGSFIAGAIYGFGPFTLSLAKFHPTAGLLAASIPWMFCPAAFVCRNKWRWLSWPISALPFLAIVIFFRISIHYRLFSVPIGTRMQLGDLAGLIAPLAIAQRSTTLVSFYHVPIIALLMGFAMLLAARRVGVIIILCLGTILAFCDYFFSISPIIWLTIPAVCCSVLIGVGLQALCSAGYADRKWVLLAAVVSGALAIVTLLLATKYFQVFAGLGNSAARLLTESAKMYILGTITAAIIFFLTRAKLRVTLLRRILLCSAMAVDIFFSARFVIDRVF